METAVLERVLDWRPFHDERSLDHPVRDRLRAHCPRERRTWQAGSQRLDQGLEGGSVGFGWTAELQTAPTTFNGQIGGYKAQYFATHIYREAQQVDAWPGESMRGTSVLAAATVLAQQGFIASYCWAFTIDDVIDAVVQIGPVVIGIPWFESMHETRPSGMVEVDGRVVDGHCVTITGYDPALYLTGEGGPIEALIGRNSFGDSYGDEGDMYFAVADLERLLWGRYGSEACVPIS